MKTELYYFTGTGNGLHIAKSIQKKLIANNEDVILKAINTLNLTEPITTTAERVGIIYPTYALTAPAIVKEFAHQLRVSAAANIFLYSHCGGGSSGDSIYSISKILFDNGLQVSNAFEAVYPSNSAVMTYDDQKLEKVLSKAETTLQNHLELIEKGIHQPLPKPNTMKDISSVVMGKIAGMSEDYLQFKVISHDEACVGCKTCSKVCPVENISMENKRPTFGSKCEMCLSCVNQCPKQSLRYGRMKKEKLLSYRHPDVALKELMYR